ncbi:hypothetical protein AALO_G00177120 [Alosa alosa]|uniref:Protein MMS22-like n=1 Tax=Alosa alosa TaxID=278164 RepID=A0AAV6G7V0_9TELE|nr:hypothetical protein AALO_G00177120 [Alosa alosa]
MHVHCCLSLTMLWEPNTSAVTTLWEYYSKNLNASFAVPWLGVSGLGSVGRGPLSLLELAQACCSPAPLGSAAHTQLYRACSSFAIFLRVLALHLGQENAGGAPWRQIKGRIYSKFHQRRMAELSELGLMNFLLLFLVLARSVELEDASGRAFDLMALLPAGTMPPAHRALLWRGQLALLLLYVGRGLDAGAHADRLATSFTQVAREFYLKTTEPSRKLALWQPLGAYLDGVTEVLETSGHLCQAEERLLNEGFAMLLPACRQSELASTLGFLQTALAQLRRVHQRCSQAPSSGFTVLALDMPGSAPQELQPHPVQSIMHSFGWDEMLHPLLVSRFLNHLLQNSEVVASVSSAQGVCVRAWIRCVLQQYLHKNTDGTESRTGRTLDEQLCELTRLVLRLPEVESVLQRAGLQPSAVKPEPKPALAVFIKAVGRVYSGLQLLSERTSMVARALDYVGDILKYIKPYQLNKSQEGLQLSYWAVGCLVKHWSPLLATSKAQQLLFRIVDSLLLPHSLFQQDPPTQVLSALKESLPLYLQGLSVAVGVSQSQGAHLKQQLRNVISQYLSRFLPAAPSMGAVANHPVLLAACEATPTPRGVGLRRNILQVISDSFLQFKGHAPPPRLAAVLAFLLELLRRSPDTEPALLSLPLPALLRCLMLVNEPQVRRLSTEAVQLVVGRCGSSSAQGPCNQTVSILRTFVEENEGVYDQQMYGVLEAISLVDRSSVEVLIPVLSLSLRNLEQKRGLGKNTSLRNAYKRLLCQLGESGQAERVCLDAE